MVSKKQLAAAILALGGVLAGSATQAAPVQYAITVSGGWFDSMGTPYGMPLSPTLTGSITVDNALPGIAGLIDFSLATGSKTWTEADFVGGSAASLTYDPSGALAGFGLNDFQDGLAFLYIYSNNTMAVFDGRQSNACNGCVTIGAGVPVNETPEPGSLALAGLALLGAGLARRRRAA